MDNTNIVPIESQTEILNQLFKKLSNEARTPKRSKQENDENKPSAVTQLVNIAKKKCTFLLMMNKERMQKSSVEVEKNVCALIESRLAHI